ncbi:extracellular superoxide dismutase Cu-Zn [Arapaima gigas]
MSPLFTAPNVVQTVNTITPRHDTQDTASNTDLYQLLFYWEEVLLDRYKMAAYSFLNGYKLAVLLIAVPCFVYEDFSQIRGFAVASFLPPEIKQFKGNLYARCKMKSNTKLAKDLPRISGQVLFKETFEKRSELQMIVDLKSNPSENDQQRAIHIHQFGDLSNGCDSTGGHYNPLGVNHPNHPGDFGNFVSHNGTIWAQRNEKVTLTGGLSVLGRAVVVHEGEDDLGQGGDAGSLLHGNAGRRLACCIIGISSDKMWKAAIQKQKRRT